MPKRILLISYYFSPGNLMGAVRPTKLVKYITKFNYEVEVIASEDNRWLFLENDIKVDNILKNDIKEIKIHRLNHSLLYRFIAGVIRFFISKFLTERPTQSSLSMPISSNIHKISLWYSLKKNFMFVMSIIQDVDFLFRLMFSRKLKYVLSNSDVVISSYGPYASHFGAYYVKWKLGKRVKWIADFRDPVAQITDTLVQYKINKVIENKICKKADTIVAVSEGYLDEITDSKFSQKKHVITNGFDIDDLANIDFVKNDNSKLIFSYTGTTYRGKRDLQPILRVLNELISEKSIDITKIEFHYAGPESSYIESVFEYHNLGSLLKNHALVERRKALEISFNSNLIIVATWDSLDNKGVLPGKYFESMLFGKPLIVLVNTQSPGSEIVHITNRYKLGLTYENCSNHVDFLRLKEFIHRQYLHNLNSPPERFYSEIEENPFNYKNLAQKYISLF